MNTVQLLFHRRKLYDMPSTLNHSSYLYDSTSTLPQHTYLCEGILRCALQFTSMFISWTLLHSTFLYHGIKYFPSQYLHTMKTLLTLPHSGYDNMDNLASNSYIYDDTTYMIYDVSM
jgi:hypothetical protein